MCAPQPPRGSRAVHLGAADGPPALPRALAAALDHAVGRGRQAEGFGRERYDEAWPAASASMRSSPQTT